MTIKSEVQRRLHGMFHPLLRRALDIVYLPVAGLVHAQSSGGWKADFTKRLERANTRAAGRIGAEFGGIGEEARKAGDLLCVISDLERYHFPRWMRIWLEELDREGITKEE